MAFFAMALAAALATQATQAADDGPPVLVLGARFLAEGRESPATAILHVPTASCYRWEIDVVPQDRRIQLSEVFELPAPAPRWGADPAVTTVAPDRASAVTRIEELLADGRLTYGWCVAEGDPLGPHRIIVYAGERPLYEFRFNVVPAAE